MFQRYEAVQHSEGKNISPHSEKSNCRISHAFMAVLHVLLSLGAKALLLLFFFLFVAFLGFCVYIKHLHLKYDHIPGPPRDR